MKKNFSLFLVCILLIAALAGNAACTKNSETGTKNGSEKNESEKAKETDRQISPSVLKKLGMVKEPRPSVTMDVHHVYSPGISYLGSLAGTLEAYDPRLIVTRVVFYSGPVYEKCQEKYKGKNITLTIPMRPATALLSALENLGYQAYVGYSKTGFKELKETYLKNAESGRYQEFKSEDDAFSFLKRVLSSGFPVIVEIDEEFVGGKAGSQYVVVTGYDDQNVYINNAARTAEEGGKNRAIKIVDFLKAWGSGEVAKRPNLMLFVEKVGGGKPDVEILAQIRKECKVISTYLNKDADRLEKGKMSIEDSQSFGDLSGAKRSALVVFLKEKNFNDIAENYNQIAMLYAEMRQETDPKEGAKKLRKIAKKEKEAYANWQ